MKNYLKFCLAILLTVCAVNFVHAQNDQPIVIPGHVPETFGQKPIPVSLEGFSSEAAEVLKFDLYVQGFSFVSAADAQ